MSGRPSEPPPPPGEWVTRASCKPYPKDVFYPEAHSSANNQYDTARTICGGCTVRDDCGEYALEHVITHGMWGGMSPRERKIERGRRYRDRKNG